MTKRIRDTSRLSYAELVASLPRRERQVIHALAVSGFAPTAYELAQSLMRQGVIQDVNGCRPRLTALYDKGLVAHGEKRRCTVTGKWVLTWRVCDPPRRNLTLEDARQLPLVEAR